MGFLNLVEGFKAPGLIVGVAAVGLIAFRSGVEPQQQSGVLRALGWQRELVARSFPVERTFVVGLGMLAGTSLGIALSRSLVADPSVAAVWATFAVPVPLIAVTLRVTLIVSLLMPWLPARQASRIAPDEVLRCE